VYLPRQQVAHAQLSRNLVRGLRRPLVERRTALGNDLDTGERRELSTYRVSDALGEIRVLRSSHVFERQHGQPGRDQSPAPRTAQKNAAGQEKNDEERSEAEEGHLQGRPGDASFALRRVKTGGAHGFGCGCGWWRGRIDRLRFGHEPVATTRHGFDERRIVRRVAESLPQLADRRVEPLVEFDVGVTRPEPPLQFFAAEHLTRSLEQDRQNLEGLALQGDAPAAFAQLLLSKIGLEETESDSATLCWSCFHAGCPSREAGTV
jgi:hypothetical protein